VTSSKGGRIVPIDAFFAQPGQADLDPELNDAEYARRRLPTRTYLSRSFKVRPPSRDAGFDGRYINKVFDQPSLEPQGENDETSEAIVIDGPRRQIKLFVTRDAGCVKEIKIQRVPSSGSNVEDLLILDRASSGRLISLIRALDSIPVSGETTRRIDDDIINYLLEDPEGMSATYERVPHRFAQLISEDVLAADVIAIARRRQQVEEFRLLLENQEFFTERQEELGLEPRQREKVWQIFLEANPWVLGVGLSGQLLTSWSKEKLEQVVKGTKLQEPGKRIDALLRTAGKFNALVFAEIKHHDTHLLQGRLPSDGSSEPYRSGCWAVSSELSGGVTQIQQTVHLASAEIGESVLEKDEEGAYTGRATFLIRPRSFLIAGDLSQLCGTNGGIIEGKWRSFELYRRNLHEPEIVTFDELLARAEWHLAQAEQQEIPPISE
jgi:hypothetical protein